MVDFVQLDTDSKVQWFCFSTITGKVVAGDISTSGFTTDLRDSNDDTYNNYHLEFTEAQSPGLIGRKTLISDYVGATRKVVCGDVKIEPNPGDKFRILVPIDLTGATVTLHYWYPPNGKLRERSMTVDDAASGYASYRFVGDELFAGTFEAEVKIVDSGGLVSRALEQRTFVVRKAIEDVRKNP